MEWLEIEDGQAPDEAQDWEYIWICWGGGNVELVEGWSATIDWTDATHWMGAEIIVPEPPK